MLTFTTRKSGNRLSSLGTRAEIEKYLADNHGISRARFREILRNVRQNEWLFDEVETETEIITLYLEPRKMWVGIRPKEGAK